MHIDVWDFLERNQMEFLPQHQVIKLGTRMIGTLRKLHKNNIVHVCCFQV